MSDSVDDKETAELATQDRQDVALFLVDGTQEKIEAFTKRANAGRLESCDEGLIIGWDIVSQFELDELFKTIPLRLSEMMGRMLSIDCCESLMKRINDNYRICPQFYNLIADHKIGDTVIVGNVVIVKSSLELKEWQRRKLKAEGCAEESRSKIPADL